MDRVRVRSEQGQSVTAPTTAEPALTVPTTTVEATPTAALPTLTPAPTTLLVTLTTVQPSSSSAASSNGAAKQGIERASGRLKYFIMRLSDDRMTVQGLGLYAQQFNFENQCCVRWD